MSFMSIDTNILKKNNNLSWITAKRIHHDKVGFFPEMQGSFKIQKSM